MNDREEWNREFILGCRKRGLQVLGVLSGDVDDVLWVVVIPDGEEERDCFLPVGTSPQEAVDSLVLTPASWPKA